MVLRQNCSKPKAIDEVDWKKLSENSEKWPKSLLLAIFVSFHHWLERDFYFDQLFLSAQSSGHPVE